MSNPQAPTFSPDYFKQRWCSHIKSITKEKYFIILQKCKDNKCKYCYYTINDIHTKVFMDLDNNLWIRLDTEFPKEYLFALLISI